MQLILSNPKFLMLFLLTTIGSMFILAIQPVGSLFAIMDLTPLQVVSGGLFLMFAAITGHIITYLTERYKANKRFDEAHIPIIEKEQDWAKGKIDKLQADMTELAGLCGSFKATIEYQKEAIKSLSAQCESARNQIAILSENLNKTLLTLQLKEQDNKSLNSLVEVLKVENLEIKKETDRLLTKLGEPTRYDLETHHHHHSTGTD